MGILKNVIKLIIERIRGTTKDVFDLRREQEMPISIIDSDINHFHIEIDNKNSIVSVLSV